MLTRSFLFAGLRSGGIALATLAMNLAVPLIAQAHFLWVVDANQSADGKVHVYFSEEAAPDNPALLEKILGAKLWEANLHNDVVKVSPLKFEKGANSLEATFSPKSTNAGVFLDYGVMSKGGAEPYLLRYCGRSQTIANRKGGKVIGDAAVLPLEVVAERSGDGFLLRTFWQGQPAEGIEVTVDGGDLSASKEGVSNAQGELALGTLANGLYSIRVKKVLEEPGKLGDKEYKSIRIYSTTSLLIKPPAEVTQPAVSKALPELPRGITSFGGAVVGDVVYVYGGHAGGAHHYAKEDQSRELLALNVKQPSEWKVIGEGPERTGLAMVAVGNDLYRMGGFIADNGKEEKEVLKSTSDFARWDAASKQWIELPALPEPRSSLDAAVIGKTIYVVGGWNLNGGGKEAQWHETAWKCDVSANPPVWQPIANPPFLRRALSLAEHQGKLYVIGGMKNQGGPTTEVAIYDPATNSWSSGPALPGDGMEGFGNSAFAINQNLFVSVMSGKVYKLSADGSQWDLVHQLEKPRFFHRMLPISQHQLVFVGGASMESGKAKTTEVFEVK